MTRVCLVTGNVNKLREIEELLEDSDITLRSVAIDLLELQGSCESITRAKCNQAWSILKARNELLEGELVLVDDVALKIDALGGHPGPYVKDFIAHMKLDSIHRLCEAVGNTKATAIASFGLFDGTGDALMVTGECEGNIVAPAGDTAFGWDPIFQPVGRSQTFAQMTSRDKSLISHRGEACRKLASGLSAWLASR